MLLNFFAIIYIAIKQHFYCVSAIFTCNVLGRECINEYHKGRTIASSRQPATQRKRRQRLTPFAAIRIGAKQR